MHSESLFLLKLLIHHPFSLPSKFIGLLNEIIIRQRKSDQAKYMGVVK